MKTVLIVICFLAATLAAAQVPTPAPQVAGLASLDPVSSAAMKAEAAVLLKYQGQLQQLQQQAQGIVVLMKPEQVKWRVLEAKALANANLDPSEYAVSITADPNFIKRPGTR